MQGLLTFLDPPRPDTKETVRLSRENGVAVKMITGDHLLIAMETARVLDMGDCIQSAEGLPLLDKETKAPYINVEHFIALSLIRHPSASPPWVT